MIPAYRKREISALHDVFHLDAEFCVRRKAFCNLLKTYYPWANATERGRMFDVVYDQELARHLRHEARESVLKRQKDVLKLFGCADRERRGQLSLDEFTAVFGNKDYKPNFFLHLSRPIHQNSAKTLFFFKKSIGRDMWKSWPKLC